MSLCLYCMKPFELNQKIDEYGDRLIHTECLDKLKQQTEKKVLK